MSLIQFQASLAELIRLPKKNREPDELNLFLNRFNLSQKERKTLEALALDPKVAKYGHSMAGIRWETPELQLRLAKSLIPKNALEYLFWEVYDPQAVKIRFNELTDTFLKCLIEDPKAHQILKEAAPSSVFDVLKFERIQLAFYRGDISIKKCPVPQGSLLRHRAFRVLKLEYDIPEFVLSLSEETNKATKTELTPRQIKVLFIPDEVEGGPRYFEVDEEIYVFLENLFMNPMAQVSRPASYEDLLQLGLCQPIA